MRPSIALLISSLLATSSPAVVLAQHHDHVHPSSAEDSAFRAMQARGRAVMGVDQYTSVHRFDALPDGGRIVLERDRDDSTGAQTIRAHLRTIARAFAAGDFTDPATVHDETVPGVAVMRARRTAIHYEVTDLSRGAELRIRTSDALAVKAIHRFLAYQRREHRT